MKLPYQIIRTADVRKLQAENDLMHRILQSDTDMIYQVHNAVRCYQDTLNQYAEALEQMTVKAHAWQELYKELHESVYAAEAITEPADPAQYERRCNNCRFSAIDFEEYPCVDCCYNSRWEQKAGAAE